MFYGIAECGKDGQVGDDPGRLHPDDVVENDLDAEEDENPVEENILEGDEASVLPEEVPEDINEEVNFL